MEYKTLSDKDKIDLRINRLRELERRHYEAEMRVDELLFVGAPHDAPELQGAQQAAAVAKMCVDMHLSFLNPGSPPESESIPMTEEKEDVSV